MSTIPEAVITHPRFIIGMVHLLPLPGAALGAESLQDVIDQAQADARALEAGGVDAVLVQNRGDRIFPANQAPPDVVAAMGAVVREVVNATALPVGVHVLRNDTMASLAIAHVAGGRFIRAAVLTGMSQSAQGWLYGDPYATLRYRHMIGADHIAIFADIASMHNQTPAEQAPEAAYEAVFFGAADAVIVADPSLDEMITLVDRIWTRVKVPVLIGGHASAENIQQLMEHAHGAVVGGAFEQKARQAGVDVELVHHFMQQARGGASPAALPT